MINYTYEEFIENLWKNVEICPKDWRKGQSVFNVIDDLYGVARAVQFEDGIDCFYLDKYIDDFIEAAWKRISK